MEYIHIRNLEKYHAGYTDRPLQYAKIFIAMADGDPDCEIIDNEVDWGRFIRLILLELRARKPLPNLDSYWFKKGFNIKKRPMSLTLKTLRSFIEVRNADFENHVLQSRVESMSEEESITEKSRVYTDFEKSVTELWNSFVSKNPILSKIEKISEGRRIHLKKRFASEHFKENIGASINAIANYKFLLGENKSGWKISFDWLIGNDTNYLKILEGKYANSKDFSKYQPIDPNCQFCKGTGFVWVESKGANTICNCRIKK